MGAVSTCPAFLDALRTALMSEASMSGVAVFTGPVDDLSVGKEAVVFAIEAQDAAYENDTVPMVETEERYEVEGRTWVVKPGAGEANIKVARDRAFAILEAVHDYLAGNDTVGSTVTDARIVGWRMEQYALDGARDCRIAFTVRVRARFTPA